ncbi:hypothetical protein JOM56_006325 [Amanita muscaria]
MAATPDEAQRRSDSWNAQENQSMMPGGNHEPVNTASLSADDRNIVSDHDNAEYARNGTGESTVPGNKGDPYRGEKQVKPNKVYVGGLPENTRQEDLRSCFGKLGKIVNIELKVGYGFVEFDSREAAEESVAKYHEGFFMGNKIRVELSHGGGRTAKFNGDPGACFKCGDLGHWARECPNASNSGHQRRPHYEPPLLDRIQREHTPSRSLPPARDDYSSARYPARDSRYEYPPPAQARDLRRPPSPRDLRDYPPQSSRVRDFDDYRRGPPVERERFGHPPSSDYRGRYVPPPEAPYRSYGASPPLPPPASYYERYERRPNERYPSYPPPPGRARTPPRARDDYERDKYPPRDYHPEYRGRPPSPQPGRYPDYGRPVEAPPSRYRRRSESPPPRTSATYDTGYTNSGYSGPSLSQPHRGAREYAPPRGGRDPLDINTGYRRP